MIDILEERAPASSAPVPTRRRAPGHLSRLRAPQAAVVNTVLFATMRHLSTSSSVRARSSTPSATSTRPTATAWCHHRHPGRSRTPYPPRGRLDLLTGLHLGSRENLAQLARRRGRLAWTRAGRSCRSTRFCPRGQTGGGGPTSESAVADGHVAAGCPSPRRSPSSASTTAAVVVVAGPRRRLARCRACSSRRTASSPARRGGRSAQVEELRAALAAAGAGRPVEPRASAARRRGRTNHRRCRGGRLEDGPVIGVAAHAEYDFPFEAVAIQLENVGGPSALGMMFSAPRHLRQADARRAADGEHIRLAPGGRVRRGRRLAVGAIGGIRAEDVRARARSEPTRTSRQVELPARWPGARASRRARGVRGQRPRRRDPLTVEAIAAGETEDLARCGLTPGWELARTSPDRPTPNPGDPKEPPLSTTRPTSPASPSAPETAPVRRSAIMPRLSSAPRSSSRSSCSRPPTPTSSGFDQLGFTRVS